MSPPDGPRHRERVCRPDLTCDLTRGISDMHPPCLSARSRATRCTGSDRTTGLPAVPARAGRVVHHTPAPGATAPGATGGGYPVRAMSVWGCSPRTAGPACRVGRVRLVLPHLVRRGVGNRGAGPESMSRSSTAPRRSLLPPTTAGARRSTDLFPGGCSAAHRADRARRWAQVSALGRPTDAQR
jgi:hypothetical protein